MSWVVLRIPPHGLHQRTPTLGWSSMNSPYCCLMEMGTQTNEQPLPGSAPWVLINPDAETLMALIFQTKRCLRLAASWHTHNKREFSSIRDTAQRQRGCSVHVTPGPLSSLPHCWKSPPTVPICVCWKAQSDAAVMSLCRTIKGILRRNISETICL